MSLPQASDMTKYELIWQVLPFAAFFAEFTTGSRKYTHCVMHWAELGCGPLYGRNVIDSYPAPACDMLEAYLAYFYAGGTKPEWMRHIEGS